MEIVPLGRSIKEAMKEGEVVSKLVAQIKSIPNHSVTLKFDIGLTLYIANIVENVRREMSIDRFIKLKFK